MTINSRKCRELVIFQVYYILIVQLLIDALNAPQYIVFLTDIINALLCLYMLRFPKTLFYENDTKLFHQILEIYIVYLFIDALLNLVPLPMFIWGCRKLLRGLLYFFACIRFLEFEDYIKFLDNMFILQIVNVVLSLYQFFVLGLVQDNLGGIFGTASGCNALSNLFFCVLDTYYIFLYLRDRRALKKLVFVLVSSLLLAALAELKAFFLEFAVIVILVLLVTRFSFKKILLIVGSIFGLSLSLKVFAKYFPGFYSRMTTLKDFLQIASDVGTGYNISRSGAFQEINNYFFNYSMRYELLGYGLGGCETSPFEFLTSDFYKAYGSFNYVWLGHAITYLETGALGTVLALAFFLLIGCYSLKLRRQYKEFEYELCFSFVFSMIVIVNFFYNNFIRADIQYFVYFILAFPFVIAGRKKDVY